MWLDARCESRILDPQGTGHFLAAFSAFTDFSGLGATGASAGAGAGRGKALAQRLTTIRSSGPGSGRRHGDHTLGSAAGMVLSFKAEQATATLAVPQPVTVVVLEPVGWGRH